MKEIIKNDIYFDFAQMVRGHLILRKEFSRVRARALSRILAPCALSGHLIFRESAHRDDCDLGSCNGTPAPIKGICRILSR